MNKPIHVWYHFKHLFVPFVMIQISRECFEADTKYNIMNTCTVCILEKQNVHKIQNVLLLKKCAERKNHLIKLDKFCTILLAIISLK